MAQEAQLETAQEEKGRHSRSAVKLTEGVIWKQLLLFFFPIVLGTFFQQLYNTADVVVVGQFVGKEALAAVGGSSGQIVNFVVGFFVGLSSGATVIIAQFYGAHDREELNKTLHTALAFSIAGGLLITVLGIVLAPSLLRMMNTPEEIIPDSVAYLRIYFSGILFVFIYNIGSGILRAVGDSKRPLYFLIVCCIINIVLDVVFVAGFGMGVAGAALATLIAQAVSAVLVIWALARSKDIFRMEVKRIRFHARPLRMILWIGLPAGLQSVLYSLSNIVIQTSLNAFGTDTMAAWSSLGKLDAFYWMVSSAFGIAITTFVGQCYGAGKYKRMRKSVRVCFGMAMVTAILISALLLLFGKYVFRVFTGDQEVIRIGVQMLNMMAPSYFIYVFIEIFSGALRGRGDVIIPMILTCGGVCGLRVLWIMLAVPVSPSIFTIILSYPITWVVTAILFIIYYWIKNREIAAMPDREETKNA